MKVLVCVFLLVLGVFAEESHEQKKVDKRGLLGLGYGYGHSLGYIPTVVSTPAVSYSKVSLGHGLGYGNGLHGLGYGHGLGHGHYGLGYGHGLGYKTVHYAPTYSYYGGLHGYGHGYYGHHGYY
ncbi:glycine-rich protein-like [Zootermopsis nevadensis]|uniref:glycine-rich protein-like n=1 Tax=Zootermopsis nevadensis TaxID=136037 RepID=UPI000B8E2D0B|nr:glycine-rich protein-like [Zootermopsis nevadensis]